MKRPLSIVATDQEALVALLSVHASPEPRILDVTHNRGHMWRGLPFHPHRSDRDPALFELGLTDTVADFRELPFPDGSFDVIVFDPPHITDATSGVHGSPKGGHGQRYGVTAADYQGGEGDISFTFDAFLLEARRVLASNTGVVLAKIADQVHGQRYRWQARTFQNLAEGHGFTCCDLIIRASWARGGLIDPRWQHVYHVRQVHTYWLALRSGRKCVSATAPRADRKLHTAALLESA